MAMTFQRNYVLEYSSPMFYTWLTFTTGRPLKSSSWNPTLIRTFHPASWKFMLIAFLSVGMAWAFIHKTSETLMDTNYKLQKQFLWHVLEKMYFTFLGQPYRHRERSTSLRIVVSVWTLGCIIISTLFLSTLIQFLTYPLFTLSPQTFEALSSSDYEIEMQQVLIGGAGESYFASGMVQTTQKLFNMSQLHRNESFSYLSCYLKGIRLSKHACLSYSTLARLVNDYYLLVTRMPSGLVVSPEINLFVPTGLVMEKGAILPKLFSPYLDRFQEVGLASYWRMLSRFNLQKTGICNSTLEKLEIMNFVGKVIEDEIIAKRSLLKLEHIASLNFIFTFTLVLVLVIFASELMIGKIRNAYTYR
jgi:hypothetical protein